MWGPWGVSCWPWSSNPSHGPVGGRVPSTENTKDPGLRGSAGGGAHVAWSWLLRTPSSPHMSSIPPPPCHPPRTCLWHPWRPAQQLGHRRQATAQKPFPWTAERTHSGLLSGLPVRRPGPQAAGSRSGVLAHVSGVWDRNSQKARTRREYCLPVPVLTQKQDSGRAGGRGRTGAVLLFSGDTGVT